jgi:hypothetical protein
MKELIELLAKIDKLLCRYLGLEEMELTPQVLEQKKDGQLMVLNTESFKRHAYMVPIAEMSFTSINNVNRNKLGAAIGRMMANHLVISFDEIIIKRETIHAG